MSQGGEGRRRAYAAELRRVQERLRPRGLETLWLVEGLRGIGMIALVAATFTFLSFVLAVLISVLV